MSKELNNPFGGSTQYRARPSASLAEYRALSPEDLATAQAQWDSAEKQRLQRTAIENARMAMVARDAVQEEPLSKALENRLRVAFLSTKGATVKDWLEQRDAILSKYRDSAVR
jgi:hypothetical protein